MRGRSQTGVTLALAAVCAIVLIVFGISMFNLAKLLGGGRELQHAADAGTLSVAKVGVETPNVKVTGNGGKKRSPFEGLIDHYVDGINLQTYNRAVGQTFLVAMNAEAEGTEEGLRNARKLIDSLQGQNGIGAQLTDKLAKPGTSDKSWVSTSFLSAASPNSMRMLGNIKSDAEVSFEVSDDTYKTSYVRPKEEEMSASNTNIALGQNFESQIPFGDYKVGHRISLPGNAVARDNGNNYRSLRGYDPIKVGKVGNICAVTMSPFEQPHLVSHSYFDAGAISPAAEAGLIVPPNSFRTRSATIEKTSASTMKTITSSMVGTAAIDIPVPANDPNPLQLSHALPKYDIAIPRGYLIIDNAGDGLDSAYWGILPQPSTKSSPWYGSTGVSVDAPGSGCFSNNGRLEEWMKYNSFGPMGGAKQPSLDGLFNRDGKPANLTEAGLVTPQKNPTPCHCHDLNSDPLSPHGANPTCVKYALSLPYNPGVFDRAYFPDYLNPPQFGKTGSPLTAGELLKMKLWHKFTTCPVGASLDVVDVNRSTGARLYPEVPVLKLPLVYANMPIPYKPIPGSPQSLGSELDVVGASYSNPLVPGQVTKDASLLELIEQVGKQVPGNIARSEMKRFLENRLYQIKPDATKDEIESVISKQSIKIGHKYYVYLDRNRQFAVTVTPPFWVDTNDPDQSNPDGKVRHYMSIPHGLLGTMVNTAGDFNIHAVPFLETSPPAIYGQLGASFTPSSGANNLLGVVKFTERSFGGIQLFFNAN